MSTVIDLCCDSVLTDLSVLKLITPSLLGNILVLELSE